MNSRCDFRNLPWEETLHSRNDPLSNTDFNLRQFSTIRDGDLVRSLYYITLESSLKLMCVPENLLMRLHYWKYKIVKSLTLMGKVYLLFSIDIDGFNNLFYHITTDIYIHSTHLQSILKSVVAQPFKLITLSRIMSPENISRHGWCSSFGPIHDIDKIANLVDVTSTKIHWNIKPITWS